MFLPAVTNGWAEFQDDRFNFLLNENYRGLGIRQLVWAFRTFLLGVYQPLAWVVLEVQFVVFGLGAWGYHLSSLLLHAGNGVLLMWLLTAILDRCPGLAYGHDRTSIRVAAAVAALLYSVHPLRVEVVAWVSCQPYLPCTGLAILATLTYLHRERTVGVRRLAWSFSSLLLYVAAVLCKAAALPLPIVFLLLDVFPTRRFAETTRGRSKEILAALIEKIPIALAGLPLALLGVSAKYAGDPVRTIQGGGMTERLVRAGSAAYFYVEKTIWPSHLANLYDSIDGPYAWNHLVIRTLAILVLTLVVVRLGRRWPGLLSAWFSYLVLLLPVSGFVSSGSGAVADRYAQVATIPLFALVAFTLARLRSMGPDQNRIRLATAARVIPAVIIVVYSLQSSRLCLNWRNSQSVVERAFATGGITRARYFTCLAVFHEQSSRLEEAEEAYRAALATSPESPEAEAGLGLLLGLRGRSAEGITWLDRAIAIAPNYVASYLNKGLILAEQGKLEEAAGLIETALRINPYYIDARLNLARVRLDQGRTAEAFEHYTRALADDPGNRRALRGLASMRARPGSLPSE